MAENSAEPRLVDIVGAIERIESATKDLSLYEIQGETGRVLYSVARSRLVKPGIVGTFLKVSKKYLLLHVGEFQLRYNKRLDEDIFGEVIKRYLILSRIAAVVVALSVAVPVANAQSKPPASGKRGQPQTQVNNSLQASAPDQRGTDASPVIVKILPSPKPEAEATEDAKERKEKADLDRKLVDFNGDLAYYTKILAGVAGLQFIALIGQVIFLWLAFRESRRSGDIARDAMVAGERAFVFAVGMGRFWEKNLENNTYCWRFRPDWQNSGDTPTKNMTMHTECELRTTELPQDFDFDYHTVEIGNALIPPKIVLQGWASPAFPQSCHFSARYFGCAGGKEISLPLGMG